MRKIIVLVLAVFIFATACGGTPPPQKKGGLELGLKMPETWAPDPDVPNDKMTIEIGGNFPDAQTWTFRINPVPRQREEGEQRQARQRPEGEQRQPGAEGEEGGRQPRGEGEQGQRRRRVFYELSGEGAPPKSFEWDGRGTSRDGSTPGRMAQSGTDYRVTLTVTDSNGKEEELTKDFEMDILVVREGENLRIVVPSIVFKASSAELSDEPDAQRTNRRTLNSIARSLNKFEDYKVTVEGYSNPLTQPGTPARTQEEADDVPFTLARAETVVEFLAGNGVDQGRMTPVGRGCANTVVDMNDDNFDEENWQNRRVEFLLHRG